MSNMKLLLLLVLGFILIGSISFVDGMYSSCHKEVDNDKSLTFAEVKIQKQNCNTYKNRTGDVMVCIDSFGFSLKTTEEYGIYDEQVLDLGTKLHLYGVGACNDYVNLKLEKNGSHISDQSMTFGFFTGQFSKEYIFSHYTDIGKYTLTATRQSTGEEQVVNFSVKSMEAPMNQKVITFEDFNERLITFDQRLLFLESELVKRDQIIMEQMKLITSLTNTSN